MTLQTTTRRTPSEFAADLAELSAVDWWRVWPGYSEADPLTWCTQFGWRLVELDRIENIMVRLGSGGLLYLSQAEQQHRPIPVAKAVEDCWEAEAPDPAENPELFSTAETVWSDYVTSASATVGSPAAITAFNDTAFPGLPDWSPQERAFRRPYRLAVWSFRGAAALLYISPSDDANGTEWPGGIHVSLRLRPVDVTEPVGGA